MIRVEPAQTGSIDDVKTSLQRAVELEFATLPPYLYAWYTVGDNAPARSRILDVVHEEMIHMMLACNILNSLGQVPKLASVDTVPKYPGPLPYSIGSDESDPSKGPFEVHLLHFSEAAMAQACVIEEPENPIDIKDAPAFGIAAEPEFQTIGQFYEALKAALPEDGWTGANQIDDATAFPGELFAVNKRADAVRAIDHIVSQGEGTEAGSSPASPLDFEGEVSHFYRFKEIERNQVLLKNPSVDVGYSWGDPLGIDFDKAVKAIDNPGEFDFSTDPVASGLQDACDKDFTEMVNELQRVVQGESARLGNAVRKMFDLSQSAYAAIAQPLVAKPGFVAGPAFRYRPELTPGG